MARQKGKKIGCTDTVPVMEVDPAVGGSERPDTPAEETMNGSGEQEEPAEEVMVVSEQRDTPAEDLQSERDEMQEVPVEKASADDISEEQEAMQVVPAGKTIEPDTAQADIPEGEIFRITCRNKVSETIGGVRFVDGVGYTKNGFSASWFANKDGYRVDHGK